MIDTGKLDLGRCPECGKVLVVRANSASGVEFVGCGGWPECKYTKPLPAYVEMERAGATRLPGME